MDNKPFHEHLFYKINKIEVDGMWYSKFIGGGQMDKEQLRSQIMEQLEEVNDPELNIDIVNLGLVYDIAISDSSNVTITMTLTAMGCPLAGMINGLVEDAVRRVEGVNEIEVDIVWDPPWDKSRMSRYAKIALGIPD
jgi:FeS assembly SUF system protein